MEKQTFQGAQSKDIQSCFWTSEGNERSSPKTVQESYGRGKAKKLWIILMVSEKTAM